MAEKTIFSKIIRREVPSDIVYQDELVTTFRDISLQVPPHILIIPKNPDPYRQRRHHGARAGAGPHDERRDENCA